MADVPEDVKQLDAAANQLAEMMVALNRISRLCRQQKVADAEALVDAARSVLDTACCRVQQAALDAVMGRK